MGLTVIGFCGLAVEGAAGVRAPVFEHPDGWYFTGDPDAVVPDESRWARADLEEIERRGTICLTSGKWRLQGFRWGRPLMPTRRLSFRGKDGSTSWIA